MVRRGVERFIVATQRKYGLEAASEIINSTFRPVEGELYLVLGPTPGQPLAYATGAIYRSLKDFADGVTPRGFGNSFRGFRDAGGFPITPQQLYAADGFREYEHGQVYHMQYIQALVQRRGLGSRLLDYAKQEGFELIIAEADSPESEQFLLQNDFMYTGIQWGSPNAVWIPAAASPVMLWQAPGL
jgi:hypothetical protein